MQRPETDRYQLASVEHLQWAIDRSAEEVILVLGGEIDFSSADSPFGSSTVLPK